MEQSQHVDAISFFQTIDHFQQLGRRQSELGRFAAGFFPAPGTLRIKFHSHTDDRHVAFRGVGDAENVIQLAHFFDHDHDALAGFRARESHLDELFILETVEHQQAVRRLFERHCGVEFGFRSGLQAKVVPGSFAQIFFDDRALLVHFHRIDAHVRALVFVFAN